MLRGSWRRHEDTAKKAWSGGVSKGLLKEHSVPYRQKCAWASVLTVRGEPQPQNHCPGVAAGRCRTRPALCQAHLSGVWRTVLSVSDHWSSRAGASHQSGIKVRGSKPRALPTAPGDWPVQTLSSLRNGKDHPTPQKWKSPPQEHAREGSERPNCLQNSNAMHKL